MPLLDISFADSRWRHIPHLAARLEKAAAATLAHLPKSLRPVAPKSLPARGRRRGLCTVNVLLTTDAAMRRLNRDFCGLDTSTNVLSFPQFTPRELPKKLRSKQSLYNHRNIKSLELRQIHIGDIAISYQYVVAEAKKDHKILINHITHLLIHGILHLFGYDHISDADAARMERAEKKIMTGLGLPDPYTPHTA